MKKFYTAITVLALSLAVGVTAMAQGKTSGKGARKPGCSSCQTSCATPEQMKKFKADSIDLRQEMMNKRFDLQRENLKETPDTAKVTAIKAEIEAIKVKIDALKTESKIPVSAACCMADCPLMDGNCDKCCGEKGCDKKGQMDCSKCNKSADCCCLNCNKKGNCAKCAQAADCGCAKKRKGTRK